MNEQQVVKALLMGDLYPVTTPSKLGNPMTIEDGENVQTKYAHVPLTIEERVAEAAKIADLILAEVMK